MSEKQNRVASGAAAPAASSCRDVIAAAILKAFERTYKRHGCNYDPDTCYEAADEVAAALVTHLTGIDHEAVFGQLIGPADIRPATVNEDGPPFEYETPASGTWPGLPDEDGAEREGRA